MDETLRNYYLTSLFFIILTMLSSKAFAFECKTASYAPSKNTSATFTFTTNPGGVNKGTTSLTLIDIGPYINCFGNPGDSWNDALGVESITLMSTELKNLGFQAFVQINNDGVDHTQITPQSICMWWNANCGAGPGGEKWRTTLSTKIGIKRIVNSGAWREAITIPAGTELVRLTARIRTAGWINAIYTFPIKLSADLVIPAYTCNIDNYNKKVTLQNAKLSDILSHGSGRYTGTVTEFSYLLTCDTATSVSVKFEGTPLSSSSGPISNVLANTIAATKNIGIQVLFNDTPISVLATDPAMTVINSAQTNETLKFKAYYYYNGDSGSGTSAGPVKALATITFDYF
ncbi:fimbrial protein [Citrobacter sp. BDA59-3]|uniref:fimbrial protein n=1 Tax=Citrobacter sp. BDA59-3 TaxID=2781952 RepID=UPI00187FD845|nr:fimbrial protein [Citrobacter sp. BDA59-3]QOV68062.1 type 1 fimbrial protein [Citrobacter sp. BDA59-3]